MDDLESFMKSLEDFELANLYKFKFDTYSSAGKDKILNEIKSRGLTSADINSIYLKHIRPIDSKIRCKKCFSSKFISNKDRFYAAEDEFGSKADKYYEKYICAICDTALNEMNIAYGRKKSSFINRILKKIKNKD
jgi:hypothetical protein